MWPQACAPCQQVTGGQLAGAFSAASIAKAAALCSARDKQAEGASPPEPGLTKQKEIGTTCLRQVGLECGQHLAVEGALGVGTALQQLVVVLAAG